MTKRRYLILAEGSFANETLAKTARGVLLYSSDDVVAVVDSTLAGKSTADIIAGRHRSAPIIASVSDALALRPTSLLVGTAPIGGRLPPSFRAQVLVAIDAGLEIVNGLHDMLRDDQEFVDRAATSGAKLWDVREPTQALRVFTGAAYKVPQFVVLAVGSDCAVGKKTVMLELDASAKKRGDRAEFVATGQTGIMIAGKGIAVDRVISDYVCGAAEQLVLDVTRGTDVTLVEGQGAILHPAYAPVTFGLLFGSAPDALILCHRVGQKTINGYDAPIPPLAELVELHEKILQNVKPARCIAIALNTSHLSLDVARHEIAAVSASTGLPTDDVVRFGGDTLWATISDAAHQSQKLKSAAVGTMTESPATRDVFI